MIEKPQENFVYQLENDKKVSVGPIQAPPESYYNDPQMQNLVNDSRVNFYSLMQDALVRLPNNKGSLEDISNLVRQSQFLQANCESTTLLKKTALALTHFQKGILLPHCLFDPATRQYLVLPPKPPNVPAQINQQRPVPPLNAGQNVVVHQRNDQRVIEEEHSTAEKIPAPTNNPDSYNSDQVVTTQNLVNENRVNFFTLVQEALYQLPNGRGSLEDISNLVRQSPLLQVACDSATLLKKIAVALTHFQKGAMPPLIVFDPTTQQYVVMPKQPNNLAKTPTQVSQQKPVKPAPPQHLTPQQNDHTPSSVTAAIAPQSVNAGQSVVVQQRNVSHLVQVRTPQGLKLYRLASPGAAGAAAAVATQQASAAATTIQSSGGRLIVQTNRPQQQPPPSHLQSVIESTGNQVQSQQPNEDTVIVKNSDGRYVQMPRSLLKKLINSGQLKRSNSNATANNSVVPSTGNSNPFPQQAAPALTHEPLGPRSITSNDVLNLLPTVPVRQEHLQHE